MTFSIATLGINDTRHKQHSPVTQSVVLLSVVSCFIHCYAEFSYAECRVSFIVMLNAVMLSVVMPNVVRPNPALVKLYFVVMLTQAVSRKGFAKQHH
jgi:hypothetical protein